MFKELKKFKGTPQKIASRIDGKTDPVSIADHLKGLFENLYNRTGTDEPLKNLFDKVDDTVSHHDLKMVDKVTPELIKKIVKEKIKNGKTDPEFDLTTDNLKNAPDILFAHLANFFRAVLIHGCINISLLICAIILLIKDQRGPTDDSGNYRGIALSSIILKVFDWVVLLLFDKELQTDPNQFGFQEESSASMCTWTAVEVINFFANKGSVVYGCLLDYRKAFDLVNHVIMFQNLLDRKISPIFIRTMIFMYLHQSCYIRWQQTRSYSFQVTNGTRQCGVFSPKGGFATYLDPLLQRLRLSGFGCRVAGHWFGALALADDLMLLSLSVQGLQGMVDMCAQHASETDLLFSTDSVNPDKSKTMCIAFGSKDKNNLSNVRLNGDPLPWKDEVNHLGTTLTSKCSLGSDVMQKRAAFIQTCHNLNQEFCFATEDTKLRMLRLYNTALYSSSNWSFNSEEVLKFGRTWNTNLRILFNLPWDTHCWIMEELSDGIHLRQMIFSRFLKYIRSVAKNKRQSLRSLYNLIKDDVRSSTGANIRTILLETCRHVDPRLLDTHALQGWRVYPPRDEWTIPLLRNLIEVRNDNWEVIYDEETGDAPTDEDIDFMSSAICSN